MTIQARTTVKTGDRELIMSRHFNAPRKMIFEAYSSCRYLKDWWGPRLWPMTTCKMDFRVGGAWHFCLSGPEGGESWGLAIFREIAEPEKIVYTDHFSDRSGTVSNTLPEMHVTLDLAEENGLTLLRSRTLFETPGDLQSVLQMGAVEGFSETWDRLGEHLASRMAHQV